MKDFEYEITNSVGLHARPAGLLVQKAKEFESKITLFANGKECEATRLMGLMAMCIKCGTIVKVKIEGSDEKICAAELELFFKQNL